MKILRDDRTVAVGEVIVACRETASVCRAAAEATARREVARALDDLAEARARTAESLHEAVARELGELPSDRVPEERTLFEKAATRLQGVLSQPAAPALLERCREREEAVAAAAGAALAELAEGDLRDLVAALRDDCARRLAALSEMKRAVERGDGP